jgi:hypothetical protein
MAPICYQVNIINLTHLKIPIEQLCKTQQAKPSEGKTKQW